MTHSRNTHGCCDGTGQVHHGEGALSYVTQCQNPSCVRQCWDCDYRHPIDEKCPAVSMRIYDRTAT